MCKAENEWQRIARVVKGKYGMIDINGKSL
jgi:hypothetical protein